MSAQNTGLLFGAAAALRLSLSTVFPALPDLLAGRVEVSTPVTSFKRCTHHRSYTQHRKF
jgi:phosphatidylinositol glycan class U